MDVRLKAAPDMGFVLKKTGAATFELAQAQEIDKLYLTLNGPRVSCDIPVYVFEDAD